MQNDLNRKHLIITLVDGVFFLREKGSEVVILAGVNARTLANYAFNSGADLVIHAYYVPERY